ncbi:MAG TPA: nitrate reductase molybdenum cofactor assembly chaperone [Burkholderiaceae bacterium]|nr:nitrate reductase molybdenum cofactor assembly chaperone [Burkholderiaceae bacterium]
MFATRTPVMTRTLRVLARLLSYPDAALRAHLDEMRDALRGEGALSSARLAEIDALMASIARQSAIDAEADYVQLFDSGRSTSLYLFEHVHGDSRDRGPAMIDLAQTYEQAGLYLGEGQMPDHLPVILEYASTQPPREARAFLAEMAHILNAIFNALERRASRYASVPGALLELAGETARTVAVADDPPLDEAWDEPLAFDGCSSHGQSRPGQSGQPQPIQIVRRGADQGVQP